MDPQEKRLVSGAALILAATIGYAFASNSPGSQSSRPGAVPAFAMPVDEAAFVAAAAEAQAGEQPGSELRAARRSALCQALHASYGVTDWVGTLKSVAPNGGDKGVLQIEIAPDVSVGSWNNALSDRGYDTLLDPQSAVFETAKSLPAGGKVVFSGKLFPSDTDCAQERSVSLRGSLSKPAFVMRITALGPSNAAGNEVSAAAMAVVTRFYQDLERKDGEAALHHIVPEKRSQGPLSAASLTQYFSNARKPLRLEYVQQLSGNSVQARYSYTGLSAASCAGISTATVTQRGSQVLIAAIAAKEQCALPR